MLTCIPDLGAPGQLILPSGSSSGSDWQAHKHPPNDSFPTCHRASLVPPFAGWKKEGQSPSPVVFGAHIERKGTFEEVSPGEQTIMPNTLPPLSSSLSILLSVGNVCIRIAKETGFSLPSHLKFGALSRAVYLLLYQQTSGFQEMLRSTPQLAVSSSLKEACFSGILRISCPRLLEKHFLEFLS